MYFLIKRPYVHLDITDFIMSQFENLISICLSVTGSQGRTVPCNVPKGCNGTTVLFGDPENCTHYYQCIHEKFQRRPCAPGTEFDITTSQCVSKHHPRVCQPPCPTTQAYTTASTVKASGQAE